MSDGSHAAVVCRGLEKRYGRVTALDGLDLEVPGGSVFGFLGPNGAGKTTTLRILTSLAVADGGDAQVAGLPVRDGSATRRGLIGYLDQDPRFHGWMTGRELLELVGRLHGVRGGELATRVDDVLELVGLAEAGRRSIGGYSGGMRQRLGLAQAVINRPPVLLLDEPVSSLDPEGRRDVLHIIRSLASDSTVVLSTHILSDVERVCDRVGIVDQGRMITEGPIDDLLDRYAQPVYRIEADPGDEAGLTALAERLRGEPWVDGVDTEHAGVLRVAVADAAESGRRLLAEVAAARVSVSAFERQRPSLEDVFLRLIGEARA
jgi:ABC-2 type transport system ATP-binding protein